MEISREQFIEWMRKNANHFDIHKFGEEVNVSFIHNSLPERIVFDVEPNPSTLPESEFHCKHCGRQLIQTRGQRGLKCMTCNIYYTRDGEFKEVDDEELAGGNKAGGLI